MTKRSPPTIPPAVPEALRATAPEEPRLAFECPRTWDSLAQTTDPQVRHCGSCGHLVHRIHSDADFADHARRGHCVHLPARPGAHSAKTGGTLLLSSPEGADTAWLVLLDGPLQGAVIVLGGETITVGRGPADVVIDDPSLAPQHLRFVREQNALRCYDPSLPDAAPRDLHDGDIVQLGQAHAMFKTVRDVLGPAT